MTTTVRNLLLGGFDPANPNHVYIGRNNQRRLEQSPALLAALPELRGKTLWCYCHPKSCHGDVLRELADREGA